MNPEGTQVEDFDSLIRVPLLLHQLLRGHLIIGGELVVRVRHEIELLRRCLQRELQEFLNSRVLNLLLEFWFLLVPVHIYINIRMRLLIYIFS